MIHEYKWAGEVQIERNGKMYYFDVEYYERVDECSGDYHTPPYSESIDEDLYIENACYWDDNNDQHYLTEKEIKQFSSEIKTKIPYI